MEAFNQMIPRLFKRLSEEELSEFKSLLSGYNKTMSISNLKIWDIGNALSEFIKTKFPCKQNKWEKYMKGAKDILTNEGTLDRSKLRKIILSDLKEKSWLESLLHPKIGEQINKELAESSSPYTVFVAPLLMETNSHLKCSRILVVDVPMEVQIERTILRDKVSEDHVKRIIAVQMDRKERLKKADDVLLNTGTIQELQEQVVKFHKKYLKMSKS